MFGKVEYIIENWGTDLQSEHERFLVEKHFNAPVILYDYPAKIKAFYMRINDDKKTVRAMDILFPASLLNNRLLPTFGLPTMATL